MSNSTNNIQSNSSELETVWNLPASSVQTAIDVSETYKLKHGMFAGVPILCRADECPYKLVCSLDPIDRVVGQRCPVEAGAIIARFQAWCEHFAIDLTKSAVKDEDLVDVSLIRDLVDNEIQTLRAENRIAINADFIGDTISQIDNKGNPYYESTITPEAEYKLKLQDKRYKILQLLNSTRKDKFAEIKAGNNPSQKAVSIFKKVTELITEDIDDINFDEIDLDETIVSDEVLEESVVKESDSTKTEDEVN